MLAFLAEAVCRALCHAPPAYPTQGECQVPQGAAPA